MATLSDYVSGTISLTTGSVDFTGSATGWLLASFKEGDTIIDITGATEFMGVIAEITSNTAGKLTKAWEGPNLVDAPYRMRYQADGSRVSAQARNLIELLGNGNLQAVAGLSGSANQVIMFTGPGTMTTIPKTELTSGADYDVQVDDLAARATYDGQSAGFAVLVSNVGDGRSAIYSKASNTSADWTDPAYVTGPIGETPDVTIGTVTTGAPGTDAEVTATPITGGVELDFTIPAGEGFSAKGAYSGATAYAKGDVVRDAGSSWIALQATTGNAPPTLPTTSNAYWELLAQKGQDGTGTGDVVGPETSVDGDEVGFDGPSGKLLRSLGPSSLFQSVSPIAISMHYGTLAGVGWNTSDPGGIVSTTTTAASATNVIAVASATGFFVGQLICYVATDSQYYSVVITAISGLNITLDRALPVGIASGAAIYNFYNNDAHPNTHGYNTIADDALRQARTLRSLASHNADSAQWVASGAATLAAETTASYANPGSTIVGQRGLKVTSSTAGTGATSRAVTLPRGGAYETEVVVNPGNRTGGFSGTVTVNILATFPDGSTATLATTATSGYGDAIRLVRLAYRARKGTKIAVQVISPQNGPWTFYLGAVRHYRIEARLRSLNKGRHVVFGDSWVSNGTIVARLASRLPKATIINKGVGGDTAAMMLARFDADVSPQTPAYVWILGGTNDVYASVTPSAFQTTLDAIIAKTQAIGAVPLVFDVSVCSLVYVPVPGPRLDLSRQYALENMFSDTDNTGESGVYTPTWTASGGNPAIGNGSIVGNWTKNGKLVTASIAITMGSTTTYGSGNWLFGLPEPAANANGLGGQGVFGLDVGMTVRAGMTRAGTETSFSIIDIATLNNWNATVPQTWAVGDQIQLTIAYQAAG